MRPRHWIYTLPLRLRSLFRQRQVEHELDEELRDHVERLVQHHIAGGRSPDEARYAALRALGGVEQRKEECRDMRRVTHVQNVVQDVRYALRMLRRSPAFTTVAVLSLALGIGANTAIFSAIDALMLRKLQVRNPDALVTFEQVFPDGYRQYNFSLPDFDRFEDLSGVNAQNSRFNASPFSGLSAITWPDRFNVVVHGPGGGVDETRLRLSVVTGAYFSVLGVNPSVGRALGREDDRLPGGHAVAVISDAYWERMFARATDIVGRTLTISGTTFTVVGVMPRSFSGDWVGRPTDVWVTTAMVYQVAPERPPGTHGAGFQYKVIARLAPGATLQQAHAAGQVFHRQLADDPPPNSGVNAAARFEAVSAATGYSPQRESFAQPLAILMAVVAAVLLIACANVANLLLARARARQHEMAVRLAIGAGRGRIVQQLLTESVLLAAMGGAVGLFISGLATNTLLSFAGAGPAVSVSRVTSVVLDLRPDGRVLAFSAALSLLTVVLFGVAPAFRGASFGRPDLTLVPALTGRGAGAGHARRGVALRQCLVICQVALSLGLLVGTGLFVRTLRNLQAEQLGFEKDHLLLAWTLPGQTGRRGAELSALFDVVQQRISSLPGVVAANSSREGILSGDPGGSPPIRPEGEALRKDEARRASWQMTVGPGFFDTVGQRLLHGRDFTLAETDSSPRVIIVSDSLARAFFPRGDAVGNRLVIGLGNAPAPFEIVGVAADATYNSPRERGRQVIYYPYRQRDAGLLGRMCVVVRTVGNPTSVAASVRDELRAIDPKLPVLEIDTIETQLDNVLFQERLIANLSGSFGVLAVLLACVGLYGVMSYSVARRTSEIGIRLAIGATRAGVLAMIVRESFVLVLTGVAIGVPVTIAVTRLVANRLFGVSTFDPLTFSASVLLLIIVAGLAAFLPARRASRVDSMVALRWE